VEVLGDRTPLGFAVGREGESKQKKTKGKQINNNKTKGKENMRGSVEGREEKESNAERHTFKGKKGKKRERERAPGTSQREEEEAQTQRVAQERLFRNFLRVRALNSGFWITQERGSTLPIGSGTKSK
jgi:hypothetical protein